MTPSPDRELLPQTAARQLLERAGQIDADSTSVDTLRAAAREAGISDAAFEAALVEMRGKMAKQAEVQPPRTRNRLLMTLGVAAVLFAAAALVVIPRAAGPADSDVVDREILVKCLPMNMAQQIAHSTLLPYPGSEVRMSEGSRILRVRATAEQVKTLESTFESIARQQTSCDNAPAGR